MALLKYPMEFAVLDYHAEQQIQRQLITSPNPLAQSVFVSNTLCCLLCGVTPGLRTLLELHCLDVCSRPWQTLGIASARSGFDPERTSTRCPDGVPETEYPRLMGK